MYQYDSLVLVNKIPVICSNESNSEITLMIGSDETNNIGTQTELTLCYLTH